MNSPRFALVGCGQWGSKIARNLDQLGVLGGICDLDQNMLARAKVLYPAIFTTTQVEDILSHSGIDGVIIATDPHTHAGLASRALKAGKDVFVEKPLAASSLDASSLAKLAGRNQRILMVGHIMWYHPALRAIEDIITSGQIGSVRHLDFIRTKQTSDHRHSMLVSQAPHDISMMIGLLGELPSLVSARENTFYFQFSSGITASLFISIDYPSKKQELTIKGSRAALVFNDTASWDQKLQIHEEKKSPEYIILPVHEPLKAECEAFIKAVTTRQPPRTDGREGQRVAQVIEACRNALSLQTNPVFNSSSIHYEPIRS